MSPGINQNQCGVMKKIFKLFQIFKKVEQFKIESVFYKNEILYCKVKDYVSVNPFVLPVVQILTDDALMEKVKRQDLLKLQKILNETTDRPRVKIIETFVTENKYCIKYHDQKFTMSGNDLCRDLQLLDAMNIRDACKIIYETAYFTAMTDYSEVLKKSEARIQFEKINNIVSLKKERIQQ